MTPPQPPPPGAITGTGSAPRAVPVGGTVALGVMSPVTPNPSLPGAGLPGAQTNSAWQAPEPVAPKTSGALIGGLVAAAVLAVAGIVLVVVFVVGHGAATLSHHARIMESHFAHLYYPLFFKEMYAFCDVVLEHAVK